MKLENRARTTTRHDRVPETSSYDATMTFEIYGEIGRIRIQIHKMNRSINII